MEELIDRMDDRLDPDKAREINEGLPMSIITESDYKGANNFSSVRQNRRPLTAKRRPQPLGASSGASGVRLNDSFKETGNNMLNQNRVNLNTNSSNMLQQTQ